MRGRSSLRSAGNSCALALAAVLGPLLCGLVPGAAAQSRAPATHTVVIESMSFQPAVLAIRAGDTVVWLNKDLFPHTATSETGVFDSTSVAAGQSWTHTFRTRGEIPYVCTLHPTMKARLRVE